MKYPAVWCELVCDGCAYTYSGQYVLDGKIPRKVMAEQAIREGCKIYESGDIHCQDCAERYVPMQSIIDNNGEK